MTTANLCRGWTESDVVVALTEANETQQRFLSYVASHYGCTLEDFCNDTGLTYNQMRSQLSALARKTNRQGVRDPATGDLSWPFVIQPTGGWSRYEMPPAVASIVRRELGTT